MNPRTLSLTLGALFAGAVAASLVFPPRARVYPLWVAVAGAVLCLASWVSAEASEQPSGPPFRYILPYLGWVVAFLGTTAVVGLPAASAVFVTVFLYREGAVGRGWAVTAGLVTGGCLVLIGAVLGLRWPSALLDVAAALGLT